MTETDKAREWLDSQPSVDRSTDKTWYGISATNLAKLLAAYGAAQYEAGAASERKRAKATVIGHHRFSHDGPCPKDCYYETTEKMPLREKD